MNIEDPRLRQLLAQMVAGFTRNPALRQDLERECLIHLWRLGKEQPGHTRSWYLQSCRRELEHWLESGGALDSRAWLFEHLNSPSPLQDHSRRSAD